MHERDGLERWRVLADLASKERDPGKLMELAEKLATALDQWATTIEVQSLQ
jgi:hypothetical protein